MMLQLPSLEVFPIELEGSVNLNEQPASGSGEEAEVWLIVLEVSKKMNCDSC